MPNMGNIRPETQRILDAALKYVLSVDYRVSLRWVFYRMVQELGYAKKDYGRFKSTLVRARKKRLRGWAPDTLTDETRKVHVFHRGYSTIDAWINHIRNRVVSNAI